MERRDLTRAEFEYYRRQAAFVARQVAAHYPVDDMIAEGMESLVTSLRTYRPDSRMGLGGYILQRMRWAMLDAARVWRAGSRQDAAKGVFYTDVPLDAAKGASTPPAVNLDRVDLERAVSTLPPKRRRFMEAYLRLGDVALASEATGMSAACGRQHFWQAVQSMRKILS